LKPKLTRVCVQVESFLAVGS